MKFCPRCKRLLSQSGICPLCGKAADKKGAGRTSSDKRKGFVRIDFDDTIRFQALSVNPQGDRLDLEAKAKNISLSGIYFEVGEPFVSRAASYLKVSNILWMEFRLPGMNQSIKTQGEIRRVWDNGPDCLGVGVMFVNISRSSHRLIDQFLCSALEGKEEI